LECGCFVAGSVGGAPAHHGRANQDSNNCDHNHQLDEGESALMTSGFEGVFHKTSFAKNDAHRCRFQNHRLMPAKLESKSYYTDFSYARRNEAALTILEREQLSGVRNSHSSCRSLHVK
jgi:hypothetical protein